MAANNVDAELRRIANRMEADRDALVSVQLDAHRHYGSYADVPMSELLRSGERNVARVVALLRRSPNLPDAIIEDEATTGRRRAQQGVASEDVLSLYREVFGRLRDGFIRTAHAEGVSVEAIFTGTRLLWEGYDQAMQALFTSRQAVIMADAREEERRRTAFLTRLLLGAATAKEIESDLIAYGLDPKRTHYLFRARGPDPDTMRFRSFIEHKAGPAAAPLIGPLEGDLVGVLQAPPISSEIPPLLLVAMIGPVDVEDFPVALAQAKTLIDTAELFGMHGAIDRSSLSVLPAVACDRDIGELLVSRYVDPLPQARRQVLLETVSAYLENGRSVAPAAKALFVHPNTLRYRIERYVEHTGADFDSTEGLVEVWWAIKYAGILPHLDPYGGLS